MIPSRLRDPSLWAIILGNAFSIFMAYTQKWPLYQTLWIYWSQSVIIGIVNFFRMMNLKEFSTKNLTMNDRPVPETTAGRNSVAFFFAFHYGFFHFVYACFLWDYMPLADIDIRSLALTALCVLGFLGSHAYSFRYNAQMDFRDKKPNLGTIMFYPYLRIIPMHLIIIMGADMGQNALIFFMVMKTFADAGMHMVEHHLFQKPEKTPAYMKD